MQKNTCWKLVYLLLVLLIEIDGAPKFGRTGKKFLKKKLSSHRHRLPVFIPGRSNGLDFDESSSLKIMAVSFHKNHSRRGYGIGDTCRNYRNFSGKIYGEFRCPLVGFALNSKFCCGTENSQYCCSRKSKLSEFSSKINLWEILQVGIIIILIVVVFFAIVRVCIRRYRQYQETFDQESLTDNNEDK